MFDARDAIVTIRKDINKLLSRGRIKNVIVHVENTLESAVCAALFQPVCSEMQIPLIGVSTPMIELPSDSIHSLIGRELCNKYISRTLDGAVDDLYNFIGALSEDLGYDWDDIEEDQLTTYISNLQKKVRKTVFKGLVEIYEGTLANDHPLICTLQDIELREIAKELILNYIESGEDEKGLTINKLLEW